MADATLDSFFTSTGAKEEVKSDKKLKIGIIGTGGIANNHAISYLKQEDCEIVALADIVPGKAKAFAEKHGLTNARIYEDHKEMLANEKDLDGVSVCTYNCTHKECTVDALKAGYPVLLEKPMCVTIEEAVEICKAEKETGKFVSVGFQPRFDVNMQMIKTIVQSGELGEIYYIQTGGGRRHGIPFGSFIRKDQAGLGALADIGCYSIDMVLNAIGYPKPLTVTGYKSDFFGKDPLTYTRRDFPAETCKEFGVDDFAAGFIRLEGGIILDFRIAWDMHLDTPGDTIVMGKKGSLRIPSTDCWNGSVGGAMKIYHDICGKPTETVVPILQNPKDGCDTLFDRKIRSFLNAIITGGDAPIPTSQILYNQIILSAIALSHEKGEEIKIEIPEI